MEYGKIIAVTGLSGLFELLTSKSDGGIIRSLEDKSTKFVSSRVHNFSHLESIEVFTQSDNVNLVEVFQAMEQSAEKLPDTKDGAALKKYFETVYGDLDFTRVYTSDLKKMVKWFEILKNNNIELKLSAIEEESEESTEEQAPVEEEKPAKKAATRASDKAEDAAETDEKTPKAAPKKKAATKTKAAADKDADSGETPKTTKKAATRKKSAE